MLGFKTLQGLIGHETVGGCLENEHYNATGDSVQQTTGGLLVWRKADNWTAFTDGYRTWINGPNGLEQRLNTERFEWEPDYAPGGGIAGPSADPLIASVLQVMRTTATGKSVYQWFVENGIRLAFGELDDGATSRFSDGNLVLDTHTFGEYDQDVLATKLVSDAYWLGGAYPRTANECLEKLVQSQLAGVQWWWERFGSGGKVSPNAAQVGLNSNLDLYLAGTLSDGLRSDTGAREWCTVHFAGSLAIVPTPTPVPTPTIDPALGPAIDTMRATEFGKQVWKQFLESGKSVYICDDSCFESIDSIVGTGGAAGIYSHRKQAVIVRRSYFEERDVTDIAVLLVHEFNHAIWSHLHRRSLADCYDGEADAARWQIKWVNEFYGNVLGKWLYLLDRAENPESIRAWKRNCESRTY